MHYKISFSNAHRHFITIEYTVDVTGLDSVLLQLSSWRPGRYELGNFAKNIRTFRVLDQNNTVLKFDKYSKDSWNIECEDSSVITVSYEYYSNELNAGSTYLDEKQLYVNPINCCPYIVGMENKSGTLEIDVPADYDIAIALKEQSQNIYAISSYDELVESPFIASPDLTKWDYKVGDYQFYIWFQGKVFGDKDKIVQHFKTFSEYQIQKFGSLPVQEYHFLFHLTPFKSYHGVEHTASTVITLGPDKEVFEEKLYEEFLGVSSHELYHAWNIKAIRPTEMKPYDYTAENYSKLGYIYEGLTTYMGDLCLWESGVYTDKQFEHSFEVWLEKHFYNEGRNNMSVAHSSYDTWLDGYSMGIPGRKVSIYQDGALCMFMIDSFIREYSDNKHSLHEVMKELYNNSNIIDNGYSEEQIHKIFIKYGGDRVKEVFENHIYGTVDYSQNLHEAFRLRGWHWITKNNQNSLESKLGIQLINRNGEASIYRVIENGIADQNNIAVGDVLLYLNKENIDLSSTDKFENIENFNLTVKKKFYEQEILINQKQDLYFPKFKVQIN